MDALIDRLVYKIILQDGADEEEFEIYKFGLKVFLIIAINLLAAMILSLLFGNLLILFFFLFCALPFRRYIGGRHNATVFRCFISNQIIMIAPQLIYNYAFSINGTLLIFLTVYAVTLFLFLSYRRIEQNKLDTENFNLKYVSYFVFHFILIFIILCILYFIHPALIIVIDFALFIQSILSI